MPFYKISEMEAIMKSRHKLRTMEELKRFWNSPAYQEIAPIRHKTASSRIYFVEGVAP
jgi:uncharacterized protein (DUF1330 family)